jgi:hypothetical protein
VHVDQRPLLLLEDAFLVSLGEDGFRGDAVGANAERTDLCGEVLREDFDAGLGGCVRDWRSRVRSVSRDAE